MLQAAASLAETGRCVISAGVTVEHLGPTESHQGQDWRFDQGWSGASAVTSASAVPAALIH